MLEIRELHYAGCNKARMASQDNWLEFSSHVITRLMKLTKRLVFCAMEVESNLTEICKETSWDPYVSGIRMKTSLA